MTGKESTWADWDSRWWDRQGTRGGIAGGIAFVLLGGLWTLITPGESDVLWPLRLAASLLLGQPVLDPASPIGPIMVTGTLVHLVLSAVFGMLFGALVARRRKWRRSISSMVLAGGLYGLVAWLVNVYAIAPSYGWTWIPDAVDPIAHLIAHIFGYGVPLALYIYWASEPRRRLGLD